MTIDLSTLTASQGFIIQGNAAGDGTGFCVSSAGDINGDGIDDLIVGAPFANDGSGEAYVVFGKASGISNIDLTGLTALQGFSIQGDADDDRAGYGVSSAGDINGDGIDDLIVGAPGANDGGNDAGEAYVIFGQAGATRPNIDLASLAAGDGFIIQGDAAGDQAGAGVSSAGDVNGDGIGDLIVGAPLVDDGDVDAGGAYVVFGKTGVTRSDIDLAAFADDDGFFIQGDAAGDWAGLRVSSAGDINGDGYDDLIVGALFGDDGGALAGEAYVVFGKPGATRANIDLSSLAADGFIIQGDAVGDLASVVSSAGDVNGDGYDDLIVGAPGGDDGGDSAGEAYVVFGKPGATRANIDLASLDPSDGFIIQGDAAGDAAGFSVSSAGDVDGDGYDDLIIGAAYGDDGGDSAGEAYVIFGKPGATRANIDLTLLAAEDGFAIQGDAAGDDAGLSVSAGDLNGDGYADLIVGAPTGDDGGDNAGEAYVVFGKADFGANTAPEAVDDFLVAVQDTPVTYTRAQILGNDVDAGGNFTLSIVSFSNAVGGTPVLNPDGSVTFAPTGGFTGQASFDYLVSDGTFSDTGHVTIAVSAPEPAPVIELSGLGDDGFLIHDGDAFDGLAVSVSDAGDVNGDGYDDLIIGAPNADDGGANAGNAYVVFGKEGATRNDIDVSTLADADGFIIQGAAAQDLAGWSVSSAGDVNGDGYDDLIVGAPNADVGAPGLGEAYVVFGKEGATRADIDLSSLAGEGFVIATDALAGWSVSSAGDINGDGYDDLIVGAPFGGDSSGNNAGVAYVIFGEQGATRDNIDLASLDDADGFLIQGETANNNAGWSVSSAGDVNGDGYDDLIVGAPNGSNDGGFYAGEAYVVFGKPGATRDDIALATLDDSDGFAIHGEAASTTAGFSVSSAGDINGDGIDDLIVGTPYADNSGGGANGGAAYVIFGKEGATREDIALSSLAAGDGFVIRGAPDDRAGFSVSSAGDLDGDGYDDLIVGAILAEGGGLVAGEAYVIFGKPGTARNDIELASLAVSDGFIFQGETYDYAGWSVSGAGDINGDGFDDAIVGATRSSYGSGDGAAYVIFGKAGNLPPVAQDDTLSASEDQPANYAAAQILGNDTDPNLDPLVIAGVFNDTGGTAVLNGNGSVTFTPNAGFIGTAGFDYTVFDGKGGTDIGHVTVSVAAVNDQPVAKDDTANVNEDTVLILPPGSLTGNDVDPDGDALTVTAVSGATNGTAVLNGDGSVAFTPTAGFTGTAGFDYKVSDGSATDTAHVTVTVLPVNDPPTAPTTNSVTTSEDTPSAAIAIGATDPDGDPLSYTIRSTDQPAKGTVSFAGGKFTYTPFANANGADSFTITIDDGNFGFAEQEVAVTITPVNDAPSAVDDSRNADEDETASYTAASLLANDTDIDGDTLAITGVSNASNGTVSLNGTTIAFTPTAGFVGTAGFDYTISDSKGGTDTAHVTVTVAAGEGNEDPEVDPEQLLATPEDTPLLLTVEASDPDGDPLAYAASDPANGTVTGGADGIFTYTPDEGFLGTDSFIVTVTDGEGGSAQQTIEVTVAELPEADDWRLFASDDFTGEIGGSGAVFGTNGFQRIAILDLPGAVSFDPSFNRGGDHIVFEGDAASWQVVRQGSSALLTDGDSFVTVPAGIAGTDLVFADGALELRFDEDEETIMLGEQTVTETLTPVTATPGDPPADAGDPEALARLFLGTDAAVTAGGRIDVIGTNGEEEVSVTQGEVNLDPSFNGGGDTLILDEEVETFTAMRVGSSVLLDGADSEVLVPVGTEGMTLAFADGERTLLYDADLDTVLIGSQTIDFTATPLSDFA